MFHIKAAAITIFISLYSAQASAITGQQYLDLGKVQKQAWVVGAVDGILTAQLWATNKEPALSKCLAGKHPSQTKAMFDNSLAENPEIWHLPAGFQLMAMLSDFCAIDGPS
jgi:hypothetical protein